MEPINISNRLIIIDDFYTDPDAVRNFAISLPSEENSAGNYAGIMTNECFLTQEHLEALSFAVGHKVKPSTQFTGKFRFTCKGDTYKQDIHFDPGDNDCAWASVWYGSKDYPDNCDGTIFWKHNRTGLDAIPRTLEGIREHGWNDTDDLKTFLDTDGVDHSLWTKTFTLPYKYNRLVLFRPWLFHSPADAFGTDKYSARLIQTFFLSPA
jgi:hypothetical protein